MVGGYIHHIISDIAYMGHISPSLKCLRSWAPTLSSKANTEEWALLASNSSDLLEIFIWNELHWFLEIFFSSIFLFLLSFYWELEHVVIGICIVHDGSYIQIWLHFYICYSWSLRTFHISDCPENHVVADDTMVLSWLDCSVIREDLIIQSPKPHPGVESLKYHPLCTLPSPAGCLKWFIKEEDFLAGHQWEHEFNKKITC